MMDAASEILFKASGINKSFPAVQALSEVDFDLKAGEVHALLGENGAGKSTLTRIIGGIEKLDSGRMSLAGHPYIPKNRTDAESLGIRMVMQELNLIANLTVAENIFIENLPARFGIIDYNRLNCSAKELMDKVGLADIDPSTPVKLLGIGQQQMVEIAAGLSRQCRILALDEPTASLTDSEIELLFAQITKLKNSGVGIIYISHRIEEVARIADRITILRDGRLIATQPANQLSISDIIRLMIGRDLKHEQLRRTQTVGQTALRVAGLTSGSKVKNVTFEVRRGEILGVAGLMGSGRTETMRTLFGADPADCGEIYLGSSPKPAKIRKPSDAVRNRMAFLTENRKEQGLLLTQPVRCNISLTKLSDISRLGWINISQEKRLADKYIDALLIRCSSADQAVDQLSGGNQQKVVIAKWLFSDPDILIFDEPTRGIDVGAKFEIYRMLAELAEKGKAVIMVSSDLKELMSLCDCIMVMSAGRLAATFSRNQWSEEKIMSAAFSQYLNTSKKETGAKNVE